MAAGAAESTVHKRAEDLYRELMDIDPLRKGFYKDALEGRAAVVTKAV
jgi:geranylgeranyl transferase type-2 subunit alpha